MKSLSKIILPLALPLMVASCDSWEPDLQERPGYAIVGDIKVTVDDTENVIARSDADVSAFKAILDNSQGTPMGSWNVGALPDSLSLAPGDYSLEVLSHEPEALEWNKPLYRGATSFTVKKDESVTPGDIVCKLAGAQVSVSFTDNVMARFENVSVTVSQSSDIAATFTPGESRTACFNAINDGTSLVAEFTGTIYGEIVTLRRAFSDVKAGDHYKLTFATEADNVTPSIIVDSNVRPPVSPDAPTITSSTIDINSVTNLSLANVASVKAVIDINAPLGIKELHVKIDSERLTPTELAAVGLAAEFDLAHPGNLNDALRALGFPTGDQVIDKTYQAFDITPFLSLLVYFPGNNNFILTVVDNKDNRTEQAVRFNVAS